MSSVTYIYPGSFNRNPSGGNRYITSGELQSGAGTGDAVKSGANYWTGSPQVFGPTTAVQISGVASFGSSGGTRITAAGDVQISGLLLGYAGAYAGQVSGATRYVTSGELPVGVGTGDATRTQANTFTAANVFTGPVTVSGLLLLGSQGGTRATAAGDIQVSGTLLTYAPAFSGSTAGANRYVTSGELNAGGGTVTSIATGSNLVAQPATITTSGSIALAPDIAVSSLTVGATLLQSGAVALAPLYQGSVGTGTRYVTSGELRPDTDTGVLSTQSVSWTGAAHVFSAATTLTFSGSTFSQSPNYQGPTATAAGRYVTSGELRVDAGGTVTTISTGDNLIAQPGTITVTGSLALSPNVSLSTLTATGPVLLNSGLLALAPLYQGAAAAASRYVTSGELRVDTGITSINSQTGTAQTLAVGSTGSDFNLVTTADTNTFNLPSASAFARGAVTITAQTISGAKTFAATVAVPDLTASGVSLFYGPAYQGTATGTARYITSGELRPDTDTGVLNTASVFWTGTQHVFSAGTSVTLSGAALFLSPAYQGSVATAQRYITSGELRADAGGTVTSITTGSNLTAAPGTITVTGTIALSPNIAVSTLETTGPVLLNSGLLSGAPLYQGAIAAGTRYVTSGELRVDTGITSINSQTGAAQTLAVGSAGNDFAIATTADTNTFNLPSASAFARGAVTTTAQTISGAKLFAASMVVPDLTVSGIGLYYAPAYQGSQVAAQRYVTSGELRAPGTGTVTTINVGSNLIQQPSPITVTGTIALSPDLAISTLAATGNVLVSGTGLHFAPIFQGTQTGAARYVTSGELPPLGTGTVTSIVPGSNIQIQANPLTTSGSIGLNPNLAITSLVTTGDTLVSGNLLAFSPAYQGSIGAASRYVTSGELKPDTGITSINAQTGTSQTFATATTGNDFAISSAADVHTFALPDAGVFSRGAVTTGSQTISGTKTFAANTVILGDLQVSGVATSWQRIGVGVSPQTGLDVRGALNSVQWSDGFSRSTASYFRSDFIQTELGSLTSIFGVDNVFKLTANGAQIVTGAFYNLTAVPSGNIFSTPGSQCFQATLTVSGQGAVTGLLIGGISRVVHAAGTSATVATAVGQRGTIAMNAPTLLATGIGFETSLTSANVAGNNLSLIGYRFATPTKGAAYTYNSVAGFVAQDFNVGTTKIGFQQQGTNAHNRFHGNTFIGADTTPSVTLQVSGTTLHDGPVYATSVAGANRYLTSGESGYARVIAKQYSTVQVLISGGMATLFSTTIPANLLGSAGRLDIDAFGWINNQSGITKSMGVAVHYGNTLVYSGLSQNTSVDAERAWALTTTIEARASNAQRAITRHGVAASISQNTTSGMGPVLTSTSELGSIVEQRYMAVDSTQDQTLTIAAIHGTGDMAETSVDGVSLVFYP